MEWLMLPAGLLVIALFVWVCIASDRAEVKENEQFRKEISHLPVDTQIELWNSKMRHDAERDLH